MRNVINVEVELNRTIKEFYLDQLICVVCRQADSKSVEGSEVVLSRFQFLLAEMIDPLNSPKLNFCQNSKITQKKYDTIDYRFFHRA